jgi:hypothetical protein
MVQGICAGRIAGVSVYAFLAEAVEHMLLKISPADVQDKCFASAA